MVKDKVRKKAEEKASIETLRLNGESTST